MLHYLTAKLNKTKALTNIHLLVTSRYPAVNVWHQKVKIKPTCRANIKLLGCEGCSTHSWKISVSTLTLHIISTCEADILS